MTIKTITKCEMCGSECKIGGEGETHYYIPVGKPEHLSLIKELAEVGKDMFGLLYTFTNKSQPIGGNSPIARWERILAKAEKELK